MEVVRTGFGFGDEEGLDAFSADGDYVVLILQDAFYGEEALASEQQAVFVEEIGRTMAFATPVSSSRLRNTNPLAVPGR